MADVARMTSDYGLQAAVWSGKSSVCISAGCHSTLLGLQFSISSRNAALDSFGGKSQKKVTPRRCGRSSVGIKVTTVGGKTGRLELQGKNGPLVVSIVLLVKATRDSRFLTAKNTVMKSAD